MAYHCHQQDDNHSELIDRYVLYKTFILFFFQCLQHLRIGTILKTLSAERETMDSALIWTTRCLLSNQQPQCSDVRRWANSWMAYNSTMERGWSHSELGNPNSVLRYEMLGYYIPPQYILVSRITKPTKVHKANNSIHLRMVQCAPLLIVALLSDESCHMQGNNRENVISLGSWKADMLNERDVIRDGVLSIACLQWYAIIYAQYSVYTYLRFLSL
jgi:hypothetical protein